LPTAANKTDTLYPRL